MAVVADCASRFDELQATKRDPGRRRLGTRRLRLCDASCSSAQEAGTPGRVSERPPDPNAALWERHADWWQREFTDGVGSRQLAFGMVSRQLRDSPWPSRCGAFAGSMSCLRKPFGRSAAVYQTRRPAHSYPEARAMEWLPLPPGTLGSVLALILLLEVSTLSMVALAKFHLRPGQSDGWRWTWRWDIEPGASGG